MGAEWLSKKMIKEGRNEVRLEWSVEKENGKVTVTRPFKKMSL